MALSLLMFDCDGVILEAVDVKAEAFAKLGEPLGRETADRMRVFHYMNGGVNRVEKFRWFYRTFHGREATEAELKDMAGRFAELALEGVRASALVPGITDVLNRWHGKVPMGVCSGSPQDELRELLEFRGLSRYFDIISGAPPSKAIRLQRIVRAANIVPEDAVMVGDAFADMDAAKTAGTRFYGRGPRFENSGCPWHHDLTRLNEWLEALARDRCPEPKNV